MLEAGHVGVTEHKWHVGVAIINCAKLFTLEVCLHVVLHNWRLGMCGMLSPGGLSINAISESEDVGESLVLKGIWADIDHAVSTRNTRIYKLLMWHTIWIDVDMCEWMFFDLCSVNMLECTNFFASCIFLNFKEFPAKVHINTSLGALLKSDLVSIWEFVDPLVWGPVSDTS